jgi:hypothetical protein
MSFVGRLNQSLVDWFEDRRVDFGVMDVAEGKRPAVVSNDKALQKAATERLSQLQATFVRSASPSADGGTPA